jgi:pyruvate ferredoxin oxidoreductase alpha subunit
MEPVEILDQNKVDQFIRPYNPQHVVLDPARPMAVGQIVMDDSYYTEYRYQQQEAMDHAQQVIPEVDDTFGEIFGRSYGGLLAAEGMDDAQIAFLTLGSLTSTARAVVKILREEAGIPIGLIKLRAVRPFPDQALKKYLGGMKAVAVLERDVSIGAGGIIYTELARMLNGDKDPKPLLIDYILGLGGRDVTIEDIKEIGLNLYENRDSNAISNPVRWHQVRGL